MRALILAAALLPNSAAALQYCDELWFARNTLFYQAGYCFASTLGQTVFGNAGCTPGEVTLSADAAARVAALRQSETVSRCEVDTSRTKLEIPLIDMRKQLIEPPLPVGEESACIGWQDPPMPLYAARSADAPILAEVQSGDTLLFQFQDEGAWSFVEIVNDGTWRGLGWAQFDWNGSLCAEIAG